jgi:hypothetical protein
MTVLAGCGGGGTTPGQTSKADNPPVETTLRISAESITLAGTLAGATSGDIASNDVTADLQQVAAALGDVSSFATTTTIRYCGGDPNTDNGQGSVTTVNNDADPAGRSTGDTITMTYNACVRGIINPVTTNGTRVYTINQLTGDPSVAGSAWSLDTTRNSDLTMTTATDTKTHKETDQHTASSDGVVLTTAAKGTTTHTDADGTSVREFTIGGTRDSSNNTFTHNVNLTSTDSAGKRSVVTKTPISGTVGSGPTAGVVEISQADTAGKLLTMTRLTAQTDGSVLVEIDSNGDGVIDSTETLANWRGLISLGIGGIGGRGGGVGVAPGRTRPTPPAGGITPPVGVTPPVGTTPVLPAV